METRTLIIGAGLAGMSTAVHLGSDCLVLERGDRPGGLAVTHRQEGYSFDVTGHWLHMRDPGIRTRFGGLAGMRSIRRQSKIFSRGRLVAYPYQSNLKDLPPEVIVECVLGALEAHTRREQGQPEPEGFEPFVLHHFGRPIADEFMFPYNTKLWGVPPSGISHAWCQRFVPVPDFRQILVGALTDENERSGYNATFSYPEQGGIAAFSDAIAALVPEIRYNAQVVRVHAAEKWVELATGERIAYRHLVSTMPLDRLARCLVDTPDDVLAAAGRLQCTSLSYLDLGLDRKVMNGLHWLYLPDPAVQPYRLGCYSNACESMAPPGCSSLYVELSAGREPDVGSAVSETLGILSQVGEPVSESNVKVCTVRRIEHAYVVYDQSYEGARSTVLGHVASCGIRSIGRYGKWVYEAMEDALVDGRKTALAIQGEDS